MSIKSYNTIPIVVKRKTDKKQPPLIKINQSLYKEDVLYDANGDTFLGEGRVRIVNKLNRFTNSSRTIAKCETKSAVIEKTSDNITKLIGQRQYDLLISALCSVLSHELKIRGIYSLLTPQRKTSDSSTQTESCETTKRYVESSSQTDETRIKFPPEKRQRKRLKRQGLTPYVINDKKEDVKKVVINPCDFRALNKRRNSYEDCKQYFDENSNDSVGKLSSFSVETTYSLLHDPASLLDNVDRHTQCSTPSVVNKTSLRNEESPHKVQMPPLSVVPIQKLTPDNATMKYHEFFNADEQKKMLLKKALEEWKLCNIPDEDRNLPLHVAVMEEDINRVKRQCLALKSRKISLDTPGNGKWTALKMALNKKSPAITDILLRLGADPLLEDEDDRNAIHLAAESPVDHLKVVLKYCRENARPLLEENDLWKPEYQMKTVHEVIEILLNAICNKCDDQGYTPLMLASKLGQHENIRTLLEAAPRVINKQMPTCGNTALYLAVDAAYSDAVNRGNKSKVNDNFRKTVEMLVENGADPSVDNHWGTNVNVLLTEFNIAELSMLVANKLTSVKFFDGSMPECSKNFNDYMVIKTEDDAVLIKDINEAKPYNKQKTLRTKPVIVENLTRKNTAEVEQGNASKTLVTMNKPVTGNQNLLIVKGAQVKNVKIEVDRHGLKRKMELTEEPAERKLQKN